MEILVNLCITIISYDSRLGLAFLDQRQILITRKFCPWGNLKFIGIQNNRVKLVKMEPLCNGNAGMSTQVIMLVSKA